MPVIARAVKPANSDGHSPRKRSITKCREEPLVIPQEEPDGTIRYVVTDALLRRAAKAASRKNFEAA